MSTKRLRPPVVSSFACVLKEMSVYKGALPHERNGPDMGWMRAPVIILGLFIVAITQGVRQSCYFVRFYVSGRLRASTASTQAVTNALRCVKSVGSGVTIGAGPTVPRW